MGANIDDLDAIEAREQAATPDKWWARNDPQTTLALVARIRELEAILRSAESEIAALVENEACAHRRACAAEALVASQAGA